MDRTRNRSDEYLTELVGRAFQKNGFGALCTLLRVEGMSGPYWDPLEESRLALQDFAWLLDRAREGRGEAAARRIALLMYCQLVEMTPAHEMLLNLVRVANGMPYRVGLFHHLGRSNKKKAPWWRIPPSAKTKFAEITKVAKELGEERLPVLIESFFNEDVRNSFSHSDYIFTESAFRGMHGSRGDLAFGDLEVLIDNCFGFFTSLLNLQVQALSKLAEGDRFHRWPRYEVLELLTEEGVVYGFQVHFSNGSKARFTRRDSGTEAINIMLSAECGVDFMVGLIDALEPVYKVDGKPVEDWDGLQKRGDG
jgi:hypothetical protein